MTLSSGAEAHPRVEAGASPSTDPLRFGVLGTGRIAGKLAAAMARTPTVEAVRVGSRDAARAAAFAALYDIPAAHGRYEEVLADPAVDAVYLALPPHLHLKWGRAAAAAGKAVLCEKPLAPAADDADALADACAKTNDGAGVALIDGTQWTRTPRADAFRTALNDGSLGDLHRVTAAFSFHAAGWGDTEHRLDPHRGGGVLLDLGWYCVHAALWAFGADPVRVSAHLVHEPNDAGDAVDVAASCTLAFPGGRTAGFDVSYRTAWRNWIEFAGSAGSLVCDDFTSPRDPAKVRHFRHDLRGDAERVELPAFDQQVAFLTNAAAAIRAGGDAEGLSLALRTQAVLDRLREAGGGPTSPQRKLRPSAQPAVRSRVSLAPLAGRSLRSGLVMRKPVHAARSDREPAAPPACLPRRSVDAPPPEPILFPLTGSRRSRRRV